MIDLDLFRIHAKGWRLRGISCIRDLRHPVALKAEVSVGGLILKKMVILSWFRAFHQHGFSDFQA
ncbi:hypothetical protein [Paenirhodobacter sp.]|uniref:hypothetical protein n=1 Tax=Paenirhodobacter sp. TaxID=1965326 RepID=UPI003B41C070